MQIIDMLLTPNQYSRPKTALKNVKGIVVHYVGNQGVSAKGNRNYFERLKNNKTTYASSHYIIGLEGEIIRCIPENEIAYCSNSRNKDTISIENCHLLADGRLNRNTYNSLIELCSDISKRYKLNPRTDIIRHFDVNGKKCPLYYVNNFDEWEQLKSDVEKLMQSSSEETTSEMEKKKQSKVKFNLFNIKTVDVEGFIQNGKTFVAARELLENMNLKIGWDANNETVLVDIDNIYESITILKKTLQSKATAKDERGNILVRSVSEPHTTKVACFMGHPISFLFL